MKFSTAQGFRTSLEQRLLDRARREGRDVQRLRTQVAFERFLTRLFLAEPEWVLKGGYALEVRLQDRARSTLDLDLNALSTQPLLDTLQAAVRMPVPDHFEYTVRAQQAGLQGPPEGGQRFHIEARLAGRPFSRFHVDVGLGDVLTQPPEWLSGQVDLSFAGLAPSRLRVYPLASHFAEKLHAYSRPRERQTRFKDLVDLALLTTLPLAPDAMLLNAVEQTFVRYGTHPVRGLWPPAPAGWSGPFAALAAQTGLEPTDLDTWAERLADFWLRTRASRE